MLTRLPRSRSRIAPQPPTASPAHERMSKVDTAWLRMDSPSNLMMILGVWIIKPAVSYAAACQRIEERLLKYPRFGQKVVQDATGASWVTDTRFDIKRHVRRDKLPPTARTHPQQALQARLAELALQPLDPRYPLWDFRLVEHYQGGSALLVRTVIEPLTGATVKALEAAGDGVAQALGAIGDPQALLDKLVSQGFSKGKAGSADAVAGKDIRAMVPVNLRPKAQAYQFGLAPVLLPIGLDHPLARVFVEQALFWVPQSGTVGLGVSILSYGGGVQFGIISDATLCPNPQAIIARFAPEFDKLRLLTLMLPWGD